jgi:hypothetical protein
MVQVPDIQDDTPGWLFNLILVLLPVAVVWLFVCYVFGVKWGPRHFEHWLLVMLRYVRLPQTLTEHSMLAHHTTVTVKGHYIAGDFPRGVVEVETVHLQMTEAETMAGRIGKLHQFYLGLKFPVQIVVRAWVRDGVIERRWFIAVAAETQAVLSSRLTTVCDALKRAGLGGRELNGDLYDSLQECWTPSPGSKLGPSSIQCHRRHAVVDGEYVRGLLLAKLPRLIEPNWLAPILDGELPVDFSMWLDPIDNRTELDYLSNFIVERQAAQFHNENGRGMPNPDTADEIRDAHRTREALRQRRLKVFNGCIGFVVRGDTLEMCQDRERSLLDVLTEQVPEDGAVVPLDFEHDKAPLLAVPTGFSPVAQTIQIVSPAAAMSYPFSNSSVSMPGGVDCGQSIGSKRVNRLNLFARPNPHMIIPGGTGSGKGFWVKTWLWRMLKEWTSLNEHGLKVFIVQTEKDEYTSLVVAYGGRGKVVRVDSYDHLSKLVYPEQGYRSRGAFRDVLFDLLVFDLTHMPRAEQGRSIAFLLEGIRRSLAWPGKVFYGLAVFDELGIVLEDRAAASAIAEAYRTFRSIPRDQGGEPARCGVIGLTQLPSDLLGDARGQVLAKLADTGLYLRQHPAELAVTKNALKLSLDEVEFLSNAESGDALLVSGRTRVALHLHATDLEHSFAKT